MFGPRQSVPEHIQTLRIRYARFGRKGSVVKLFRSCSAANIQAALVYFREARVSRAGLTLG